MCILLRACGNSFIPAYYFSVISFFLFLFFLLLYIKNQCHNMIRLYASNRFRRYPVCFFIAIDNCIRLVRFYRDFRQINFGYDFINCVSLIFHATCCYFYCDFFFICLCFLCCREGEDLLNAFLLQYSKSGSIPKLL